MRYDFLNRERTEYFLSKLRSFLKISEINFGENVMFDNSATAPLVSFKGEGVTEQILEKYLREFTMTSFGMQTNIIDCESGDTVVLFCDTPRIVDYDVYLDNGMVISQQGVARLQTHTFVASGKMQFTIRGGTFEDDITITVNGSKGKNPSPTNEIPIRGVGESGVLSVKSTGKNLYDESAYPLTLNKFLDIATGNIETSTSGNYYATVDYIPLDCVGNIAKSEMVDICFYDENKTFLSAYSNSAKEVTAPSGTKFVRLDVHKDYKDVLQIEKGTTATDFVPYTETKANIPVSAPLYDGDYIHYNMDGSGEECHKMKKRVFDGSEGNWKIYTDTGLTQFYLEFTGSYSSGKGDKIHAHSTHFKGINIADRASNYETIYTSANGGICFNTQIVTTVGEWKAWLAENKPEVVYELAEPTVTPLTAEQIAEFEKIQTFEKVTHIASEAKMSIEGFTNSSNGRVVVLMNKKIKDTQKSIESVNENLSHVGMIIHSTTLDTEEKVKALYGGVSWSKIEGMFLLGQSSSYVIGSTGGEAAHILTESEMPSHTHGMSHTHTTPATATGIQSANHTHVVNGGSCTISSSGAHSHTVNRAQNANAGTNRYAIQGTNDSVNVSVKGTGAHTHTVPNHTHTVGANSVNHSHTLPAMTTNSINKINTDAKGSGAAHNNMPPYKAVYIWERIA